MNKFTKEEKNSTVFHSNEKFLSLSLNDKEI